MHGYSQALRLMLKRGTCFAKDIDCLPFDPIAKSMGIQCIILYDTEWVNDAFIKEQQCAMDGTNHALANDPCGANDPHMALSIHKSQPCRTRQSQ